MNPGEFAATWSIDEKNRRRFVIAYETAQTHRATASLKEWARTGAHPLAQAQINGAATFDVLSRKLVGMPTYQTALTQLRAHQPAQYESAKAASITFLAPSDRMIRMMMQDVRLDTLAGLVSLCVLDEDTTKQMLAEHLVPTDEKTIHRVQLGTGKTIEIDASGLVNGLAVAARIYGDLSFARHGHVNVVGLCASFEGGD